MTVVPRLACACALAWGCAPGPGAADGACSLARPCHPQPAEQEPIHAATVLAVNVFDQPVFETFWSDSTEAGVRRAPSVDPEDWPRAEIVLDGGAPAASWDPQEDVLRVCRIVGEEIRCATRVADGPWADHERVVTNAAELLPIEPLAMAIEDGQPTLYATFERDGATGLYRVVWDRGVAWVPEEPPLFEDVSRPVTRAAIRTDPPSIVIDAGADRIHLSAGVAGWEITAVDAASGGGLVTTSFYGRDWFWELP